MSFSDVIKKSVLESFASADMSVSYISVVMIETLVLALYLFLIYRFFTRSTFYNRNYAVSMSVISLVTAGIILAMQSNIVISLGMVGALSIVRFRTAIKEPMDLLFLFWSIGIGIVTGAGLFKLAVIMSIFITIGIVLFNMIPAISSPELMVLKVQNSEVEQKAMSVARQYSSALKVDSKNSTKGSITLIVEIKSRDGSKMIDEITAIEGVISATLMKHEGEVKF